MRIIDYVLIGDGTSDRALLPILLWALRELRPVSSFALQSFVARGSTDVAAAVQEASIKYKPDLIFVHRDAERVPLAVRRNEIPTSDYVVPVVPIRMTEAWLLIDLDAIRIASGNPNGKVAIELPRLKDLEQLPNPKKEMEDLLLEAASVLGPRRRKRFRQEQAFMVHRVAESIKDFRALHSLEAFKVFWTDLQAALRRIGATSGK